MSLPSPPAIDPLDLYDPTRAMDAVHRSQARKRFVRAPNQVGKTIMLSAEFWWAMTGRHPHRPPVEPGPIGVLIDSLDKHYPGFCSKLRTLEPSSLLHPECRYVHGKGYMFRGRRAIATKTGRLAEFRSGTQDAMALESDTFAAVIIDEPPKPEHWAGLMQRVAVLQAPILMAFTPVGRPLDWLRLEVEGMPEEDKPPRSTGWDIHVVPLSVEACTTVGGRVIRSQESIEAQKDGTPLDVYPQRIEGAWDGATIDRTFDGYSTETEITDIPRAAYQVRLGADHGELAGHEVALLILWDETAPCAIVLDEYVNEHTSDPDADAEGIRFMLRAHGMTPANIDVAIGDINSAGKGEAGRTVNEMLGKALGIRMRPAKKGKDSVRAGVNVLNTALRRGHLRVHPRCKMLHKALRHWKGRDDDLKHYVDALRYIVADPLKRVQRSESPYLVLP